MGGKPADALATDLTASPATPTVPRAPAADTQTILAGLLAPETSGCRHCTRC